MPQTESAALPAAQVLLRLLVVLNWLSGAAILALLLATLIAEQWTMNALGIAPSSEIPRLLTPLRVIAALGVAAVPLYDAILRRLIAIVATVAHAPDDAHRTRGTRGYHDGESFDLENRKSPRHPLFHT